MRDEGAGVNAMFIAGHQKMWNGHRASTGMLVPLMVPPVTPMAFHRRGEGILAL